MDPFILYVILFAGALGICLCAVFATPAPTRACLGCGKETPVQGKRCRHCGYQPARPV